MRRQTSGLSASQRSSWRKAFLRTPTSTPCAYCSSRHSTVGCFYDPEPACPSSAQRGAMVEGLCGLRGEVSREGPEASSVCRHAADCLCWWGVLCVASLCERGCQAAAVKDRKLPADERHDRSLAKVPKAGEAAARTTICELSRLESLCNIDSHGASASSVTAEEGSVSPVHSDGAWRRERFDRDNGDKVGKGGAGDV